MPTIQFPIRRPAAFWDCHVIQAPLRASRTAPRGNRPEASLSRKYDMNIARRPNVGDWYENEDDGALFQVVSVDAASGTVQTQAYGGELDSIEAEDWTELPLVAAAAPEDWTGALEEVEPDDVTEDD